MNEMEFDILPEKLTFTEMRGNPPKTFKAPPEDQAFYYKALLANPSNNRTRGNAPRHRGKNGVDRSATRFPFPRVATVSAQSQTECSIDAETHYGKVGRSHYRGQDGADYYQILCELHRGKRWSLASRAAKPSKRKPRIGRMVDR